MITSFEYKILNFFKNSKNGLTNSEFEDMIKNEKYHYPLYSLLNNFYIEADYNSVDIHTDGWTKRLKYNLTKKGSEAIEFYEKWLAHPHTCKQSKKSTGTKYVIVEHRSGCFCTKVYHMGYTSNIGFTRDLGHATLYNKPEDAEEALAEAIKDSPTKYQNAEDYEFSIKEVKMTVNVELPKTYICKDCGKVLPIDRYYISTYCPDSWNTGVCFNCRAARERKEREAMYGRNRRGVFDYDSID